MCCVLYTIQILVRIIYYKIYRSCDAVLCAEFIPPFTYILHRLLLLLLIFLFPLQCIPMCVHFNCSEFDFDRYRFIYSSFFFSFSLNFSSLYLAYSSLNFTHNFIHFSTKSKNIQSKCISWSLFINSNYYNANYELNLMIKHEILKHLWIGIGSKL